MKSASIFCFLFAFSFFCFSQEKTVKQESAKSNIEAFSLTTGNLMRKEFHDLGKVKKVEIQSVKITDLVTNKSISGIKIETRVQKSYGSDTKSAFLDVDEVEGFVKASKVLEGLSDATSDYTEYEFTSRGGFESGAFISDNVWKYFIKLEKYDSDSYVFLDKQDYLKITEIIGTFK